MKGKHLLITGGTGSFGGGAVPRFLAAGAEKITIFSRDEYKQSQMRRALENEPRLRFILGDVRDRTHLAEVCHGVDYLIHAAAIKQVPSCEENVEEAIKTNVLGTANVVHVAIANGVDCAINLSADKALYPASVYGATKFLSEKLFTEGNKQSSVRFVNLRYSNVMASRGSVFEIFRERLVEGGTITVFDPRMRRFFLTQRQVIDLCLFAFKNSVGGETYIKESQPVSIVDLGQAMIEVLGNGKLEVRERDGRPGEKLDAVLLSQEESSRTVRRGDLFVVNGLGRQLKLEGATPVEERDYVLDDYQPMGRERLIRMIREELELYEQVGA
jgi:UDP-glucose 4-epimerase